MAKFDLKKAILENKATFHSSLKEDMGLTPLQQYIYDFESDVSGEDFADEEIDNIKGLNNLDDVEKYYVDYRGWEDDKSLNQVLRGLVKDLAKKFPNLAENKTPLTEGQFSWMTQDTGQQIGSQEENKIPVYMFDNKGKYYYENDYDGYGEFGGMDYYELLDKMNGGEGDRSRGIDLSFGKIKITSPVLYPALITKPREFDYKTHDFTQEAPNDPNQSWYMEPEEDDYNGEDYGDYNDDEDDMMEGKKKYYKDAEADDAEHIKALEKDMKDDKKSSKMKKSDLKAKIKEMMLAEMNVSIDNMEDAPESEVDFLAEVDAILKENSPMNDSRTEQIIQMLKDMEVDGETMEYILRQVGMEDQMANQLVNYPAEYAASLKEASEFDTNKPARIAEFITALNRLVDDYHAELYLNDDLFAAIEMVIKAAKEEATNLNEAEEEVAVDDTEIAVDGEENIDVDTTVKVDPNVKSVQDALTQAQAAAQKLGDSKLTDQIGNTITFFTRSHVVDQGAVAEELNESMFPLLKRILK
jgi:hypothetical protein